MHFQKINNYTKLILKIALKVFANYLLKSFPIFHFGSNSELLRFFIFSYNHKNTNELVGTVLSLEIRVLKPTEIIHSGKRRH